MEFKSLVKSNSKFALAALSAVLVLGCSPESNKLAPKPEVNAKPVTDIDRTDSFSAGFNPRVDILFVIDDSVSMDAHQTKLAAAVDQFSKGLGAAQLLDVHIGVVTTSMDNSKPGRSCDIPGSAYSRACGDGRLVSRKSGVRFVERTTPDPVTVLQQNLIVGTSGSLDEESFDPVAAAITGPNVTGVNAGFYRQDAALAIIFLTDTDDQSEILDSAQKFYDFLLKEKSNNTDKILSYGVLSPTADTQCDREGYPKEIESFLKMTNGIEFSLCDDDYGKKLAGIAADVAQKVGQVIYLSARPDPKTIVVTYGSQVIPPDRVNGWTYDPQRNALRFGSGLVVSQQPKGTRLQVDFITGVLTEAQSATQTK